jgi:WD40 repeat protein
MPDRQSSRNLIRLADASGVERASLSAGIGGISAMAFSPNGSLVAAAGNDADVRIWDARNGELRRLIDELPVTMFAMAFAPDGNLLATAGADRTVYLWDVKTWKLSRSLTGQPEMISALVFSPDGKRIATGGFSELTHTHPVQVRLWDLASAKAIREWPAPRRVNSLQFSADGRVITVKAGADTLTLEH